MKEEMKTTVSSHFISNALQQLISLKLTFAEIDNLQREAKSLNGDDKSDISNVAKKVGHFIKNAKKTIYRIEKKFIKNYEVFNQNENLNSNNDALQNSQDNNISEDSDHSVSNNKENCVKHKKKRKSKTLNKNSGQHNSEHAESTPKLIETEDFKEKEMNNDLLIQDGTTNIIVNNSKNTKETSEKDQKEVEEKNDDEENVNHSLLILSDSDSYITAENGNASNDIEQSAEMNNSNDSSTTNFKHNANLTDSAKSEKILDTKIDSDPIKDKDTTSALPNNIVNSESTEKNTNENGEQENNESTQDVVKQEVREIEEKPKIGLIKCIDITKLLDPKLTKQLNSSKNIIILSSESDNDTNIVKNKSKIKKKKKEISQNSKEKKKSEAESSDDDYISNRLRRAKKTKVMLQKLKLSSEKRIKKTLFSDSDKVSEEAEIPNKNNENKLNTHDNITNNKMNSKCYVSLPRIPVDELKAHYLGEKNESKYQEESKIKRLKKMDSTKRSRASKNVSSDSDTKIKKKRKVVDSLSDSDSVKSSRSVKNSSSSESDTKKTSSQNCASNLDTTTQEVSDNIKNMANKAKDTDILTSVKETLEEKNKESINNTEEILDMDSEKEENKNDASDSDDSIFLFRKKKQNLEGSVSTSKKRTPRQRTDSDVSSDNEKKEKSEKSDIKQKSKSDQSSDSDSNKKTKTSKKRAPRQRLGSDVSSDDEKEEKSKKSDSEQESKSDQSSDSDSNTITKKKIHRRIKRIKDSDESSDEENKNKKKKTEELDTRKKIRSVISKESLAEATKQAAKDEEERKKRIAERQKLYNDICDNVTDVNAKVDKVVLDFNEETKEELLSVDPALVAKLKPHQAKGVQFMWTACFESLERSQNTEGSGCILAHCMGLGKTLQVITLIHTLITNFEKTKVRTVLVVCPLSTVLNWVNEFKKWLDDIDGEQINVFDLVSYKQNYERLRHIQDWQKFGGVLVMGYDMFRNLSNPKGKRMTKKLVNGFHKVLIEEGPDLVICDEGHLLKNEKTGISIAMNKLRTKRRIVLTGTPLQNNLKEYFCMVQFVKPNLLGTYKEYLNRFVNPITNGQYTDSTPHDIIIMRRRAHVLHKMLDAVVERRDYNVLAPYLPPKHEYVLFIVLTPVQIELYREYIQKYSQNKSVKGTSFLFQDFQELQRICIHPRVLLDKSKQDKLRKDLEDDDSEGSLKDFINDDSDKSTSSNESSSDDDNDDSNKKVATNFKRRTRANPTEEEEPEPEVVNEEWWSKFCQGNELDDIRHSSKILLLFDILKECELIGDKLLVFSQSLYSLNLIEYFLNKVDEATHNNDEEALALLGGHKGSWALGLDYFRMDGSSSCDNRSSWCKTFNNENNTRARLFLISTRAGGLGINLVAANRVIIFDVSWNPSYDVQSIYRVYRFGQTKPCYIYRFVTLGTMENKIYERQVTKQAISKRVIDEQQIDRHYNQNDLAELYAFNPIPEETRPIPLVPKDRLFADILQSHEKHIFKYHEHNSLLEDKADEGLNEEERRAAWEEFENEKNAPKFNLLQTMVRNGMYETLRILLQEDNRAWNPAQVNAILPSIVLKISEQVSRGDYNMYRRVEERHKMRLLQQQQLQYQQYMKNQMSTMTTDQMAQLISLFNQQNQQYPLLNQFPSTSSRGFGENTRQPPVSNPIQNPNANGIVELND